ncbi:MAG TPA: YbaK/EbsC family protein [Verrucomicrobiae bacterium]|nr:YbaK/EbsC family protein [Verrucomicrobiae bacterium]
MGIPARLIDFLDESKVRYEILHHPEAFTSHELAAIEHVKGKDRAKVVMVRTDAEIVMAVLPTDRRIDLEKLGAITGRPTTKAAEAEFKPLFPDCAIGTMPPFGHLYGVATYLDRSFAEADKVVFEAGTHSDAIKMKYADYELLAKPIVAGFAVKLNAG